MSCAVDAPACVSRGRSGAGGGALLSLCGASARGDGGATTLAPRRSAGVGVGLAAEPSTTRRGAGLRASTASRGTGRQRRSAACCAGAECGAANAECGGAAGAERGAGSRASTLASPRRTPGGRRNNVNVGRAACRGAARCGVGPG